MIPFCIRICPGPLSLVPALNHPLLESVSLSDAAGIIANFSGGSSLSLFEVSDALEYIQQLAGKDMDVVMGFTSDERLDQRAQVILVVTGLGAPSLEEVLPGAERISVPQYNRQQDSPQPRIQPQKPVIPMEIPPAPTPRPRIIDDLDMPAFMRRSARYRGLEKPSNGAVNG